MRAVSRVEAGGWGYRNVCVEGGYRGWRSGVGKAMGKWSVSEVMRLKKVGKEEEEEATINMS